jgi:hypothetical protein
LPDVTGGITVAGWVVSGVMQVFDVGVVSTEGIGGGRTLGNRSVGVVVVVVLVLPFLGHGGTGDDESGRSGQDKKSHDISSFLVLESRLRTPRPLHHSVKKIESRLGKLYIANL